MVVNFVSETGCEWSLLFIEHERSKLTNQLVNSHGPDGPRGAFVGRTLECICFSEVALTYLYNKNNYF